MTSSECNLESGACEPAPVDQQQLAPEELAGKRRVVYVGDPMCSWCWGISPELRLFSEYCKQQQVPFRLVVGGLRPGGGDPWNREFREFLRRHWHEIAKTTGQPFCYDLLKRSFFNYDTEPACRSVVTARSIRDGIDLEFFSAVQRRFYVENEDPGTADFYKNICNEFEINFDAFTHSFDSQTFKDRTNKEFHQSRSWGVTSFPSILFQEAGRTTMIATGFSTFKIMSTRLNALIQDASAIDRSRSA